MAVNVRYYGAVPDGTTDCTSAIQAGINVGDVLIDNGLFLISSSLKIPSNRTIYIKNARIIMADASYDNIFRNSDFSGGNTNINIIGLGNAILDGNSENNNDGYVTHGGTQTTESYKYATNVFTNVNNFQISGIRHVDDPHFAMFFQKCTNGVIEDIWKNYYHISTPSNQDGYDFTWGCNNISIDNYRCWSVDDISILGAGDTADFVPLRSPADFVGDIHDISFSNITVFKGGGGTLLPWICESGNRIYNIDVQDAVVYQAAFIMYSDYVDFFGIQPPKEDVTAITMDNIVVHEIGDSYLFYIGQNCSEITITNLTNNSGKALYAETAGRDIVHFLVNGVDQS